MSNHTFLQVQKEQQIYDLGSLPPLLLTFAGDIQVCPLSLPSLSDMNFFCFPQGVTQLGFGNEKPAGLKLFENKWNKSHYSCREHTMLGVEVRKQLVNMLGFMLGQPIDHRWNQHGLGGDTLKGDCRSVFLSMKV